MKFELGNKVTIALSGEVGEVTARIEYKTGEPRYFVLYKAADGRAQKNWWDESVLELA